MDFNKIVDNFIICSLGGTHLKGSEYLNYILKNYPDGKYKNKDIAKHFQVAEGIIERNLRYYIQFILTVNPHSPRDYYLKNTLLLTPEVKLTTKTFIKHLSNIILNNQYKIIQFNEEDWIATKISIEETLEWYCEEFGFDKEDYIFEKEISFTECDIDTTGMWMSPLNKYDINKLGDKISISKDKVNVTFGDLMWHDCERFKFISYREAIRQNNESDDCYLIATIHF